MVAIFKVLIVSLALSPLAWALEEPPPPSSEPKKEALKNVESKIPGVTEPPKEEPPKLGVDETPHFFFSDTAAFSLYTGFLFSLTQTDSSGYGMFGFSYLWPSEKRFHLETAFDVFGNQESHLRMMAKWIYSISTEIRPYAAVGLGLRILPSDNLAVILSWTRLSLHADAGFDLSMSQHWSLKFELFAGVDQSLNSYFGLLTGPVFSY